MEVLSDYTRRRKPLKDARELLGRYEFGRQNGKQPTILLEWLDMSADYMQTQSSCILHL
jgi:hypothetical protein